MVFFFMLRNSTTNLYMSCRNFTRFVNTHNIFIAAIPIFALCVFVATICSSYMVQQRDNPLFPIWYKIDVSGLGLPYGSTPFYLFASGFTLLSAITTIIMAIRLNQFLSITNPCINGVIFFIGFLHFPAIATMGWTDGLNDNQNIHFPAAITGFGLLALYCLSQGILYAYVVNKYRRDMSKSRLGWMITAAVYEIVMALICPICVALWLTMHEAIYEWIAVFSLLAYFLPFIFDFFFKIDLRGGPEYQIISDPFDDPLLLSH